ncbi:putative F-box associated interaction domain-containing protein [Medicago truncatula]|uniref:F-box protein interaction domain protein n=1 Tax=Medicago truncatula TaxID=3880 RepID=A0A072VZZ2_MEDTR|nr:F-box protein interaction domain protein [Medicago truncatula]RHN81625.1 putative F-box associated interaction domain-containing protein [Medicago truncatula]
MTSTIPKTCNGLLCLFHFNQFCVSLWNPSINLKSKRSPAIVSRHDNIVRYLGFGYDQLNDNYKVVVGVSSLNDYTKTVTKIYTFGENSWKTLHNFPDNRCTYFGKSVSCTLNWILSKDGLCFNNEVILSFDLEKETHGEVMLPQHDCNSVFNHGMFVLSD